MACEETHLSQLLKGANNSVRMEKLEEIPSTIAQLLLSTTNPTIPPLYIGGGYAAFMCGRTIEYGDIDLFCFAKPNSASEIYQCFVELLESSLIAYKLKIVHHKQHDYAWGNRKVVITVKAEGTGWNEKQCDIVVVEAKSEEDYVSHMPNLMHQIQYIASENDLDVCLCVGIPLSYINFGSNEKQIIFFPFRKTHEFVMSKRNNRWINIATRDILRGYNPSNRVWNRLRKTKVFDNVFRQHDQQNDHKCDPNKVCLCKRLLKPLFRYQKYKKRLSTHVKTIDSISDQAIDNFVFNIMKVIEKRTDSYF